MLSQAEYIWLDGAEPTQQLRSKTRVLDISSSADPTLSGFPEWGYDGSSTNQADGGDSDLILKPVNFVSDPLRGPGNHLVMCEVFNPDGSPHATNGRARLRAAMARGGAASDPWVGFEQEYTLFADGRPLGVGTVHGPPNTVPRGHRPVPNAADTATKNAHVETGRTLGRFRPIDDAADRELTDKMRLARVAVKMSARRV